MNTIRVKDKDFTVYISEEDILKRVEELARQIAKDYSGKDLICLSILNGSYVFTADLLRSVNLGLKLSFLKLSSYSGLNSTGEVRRLIGLNDDIQGRSVLIIEDIIDTGQTLDGVIADLREKGASDIRIAALLVKPHAYSGSHKIDYTGFSIPNDFVIGYGLDYDGLGRNLRSIYSIVNK